MSEIPQTNWPIWSKYGDVAFLLIFYKKKIQIFVGNFSRHFSRFKSNSALNEKSTRTKLITIGFFQEKVTGGKQEFLNSKISA